MYSLTQATEILTKHYNIWNQNINYEVLRYNTHKLRHSNWVLETGRNLLIKIKENKQISQEIVNRAEIIFLLHDLWRFYQNNKERILTNWEFEHGDISAKIAKDEWYEKKICLAIKYHNKYNLDWLYSEDTYKSMNQEDKIETEFLSKIIRDADKLQNMIYTIFDIDGLSRLDQNTKKWIDISDDIIADLQNNIQVNRKKIQCVADELVGTMGRIFDINFKESLEILEYYWYEKRILYSVSKMQWVTQKKIDIIENIFLKYKL